MNVSIIYFSSSGNTGRMAELLAQELRGRDCRVLVTGLDEARLTDLSDAELVLLGSPAWSGERVVEPLVDFVRSAAERMRGKTVAFFGSYDWGDGRYFDHLSEELRHQGLAVHDKPLVVKTGIEADLAGRMAGFLDELLSDGRPGKAADD